jgi:hypothetical protein
MKVGETHTVQTIFAKDMSLAGYTKEGQCVGAEFSCRVLKVQGSLALLAFGSRAFWTPFKAAPAPKPVAKPVAKVAPVPTAVPEAAPLAKAIPAFKKAAPAPKAKKSFKKR